MSRHDITYFKLSLSHVHDRIDSCTSCSACMCACAVIIIIIIVYVGTYYSSYNTEIRNYDVVKIV